MAVAYLQEMISRMKSRRDYTTAPSAAYNEAHEALIHFLEDAFGLQTSNCMCYVSWIEQKNAQTGIQVVSIGHGYEANIFRFPNELLQEKDPAMAARKWHLMQEIEAQTQELIAQRATVRAGESRLIQLKKQLKKVGTDE